MQNHKSQWEPLVKEPLSRNFSPSSVKDVTSVRRQPGKVRVDDLSSMQIKTTSDEKAGK